MNICILEKAHGMEKKLDYACTKPAFYIIFYKPVINSFYINRN